MIVNSTKTSHCSKDIRLKADQPITHESIWSNGIGPSENCINGRSVQKEVIRACRRSRRQTSIFIANLNFEHPVRNEAIELAVTVIRKSLKSALNIRLDRISTVNRISRDTLRLISVLKELLAPVHAGLLAFL